jgi:hypothetical protein
LSAITFVRPAKHAFVTIDEIDHSHAIMENAPKALAGIILAEQAPEALGHNEGED